MSVGKKIRQLRRQREWSQTVLAEKLGTTQHTVCRWERTECDITATTLQKIAELFAVPIQVFFEKETVEK